ncbi:unnamed protein product [Pedinophyceae sp. YPF-701]|nr:unnamed protein product [Pedinophyceae sp. YPF-701]
MASATARERYAKQNEGEQLRRAFDKIDNKKDGKIDAQEIADLFKDLGHRCAKKDIEDMIWEVDEDCDKAVNWDEFRGMYYRCREDKTGFEPRRLYNVVEFLINDKDGSGDVSVEEAQQIMYLRYGRQALDQMLTELFGTADIHSGKKLSLSEFLHALHVSQIKFLSNRRNKAAK